MFLQKVKRFLIRCAIYQIILLWSVIKINNVEKHFGEFKNKILYNLNYVGYQNKELAEILDDPVILLVYCGLEVIFAILGVFGSFYGNLISAFLFLITNLIYFNPMLPENQILLFDTRVEVFYNIGILFAILMVTFYPYERETKLVKLNQEEELENYEETPKEYKKVADKKSLKKKGH